MTEQEIISGNYLIKQWLDENVGIGYWSNEPLNFRNDYGWMMPVIERIEEKTTAVFQIYKRAIVCIYDYNKWQVDESRLDLRNQISFNRDEYKPFEKLKAIWESTVDFIKWQNQQNNKAE